MLVWSESLTTGTSTGSQLCGSTLSTWTEERLHRSVDLGWITTSTLTLKWTSTLGSAASDESWGLSTVSVYKYVWARVSVGACVCVRARRRVHA